MKKYFFLLFGLFFCVSAQAADNILNLYSWSDVIPQSVIQQFEKETGIKVHYSTYDRNEVLYAKLRANSRVGYDVIEPSSYFVDKMRKQGMLEALDKSKISNWHFLNPVLLNPPYDPKNIYSIPYFWGVTGMFVNTHYHPANSIKKWADLWSDKYKDQLLFLDDAREAFSVGLLSLGYKINDENPAHIQQAFLQLKKILPNVKVFSSDTTVSIMIDEDAALGLSWNCDAERAKRENPQISFVYPQEGFVIWVDSFAIAKDAPHKENAYQFLNFLLRPEIAKQASLYSTYATGNLAAQKLLPENIKNDPRIYPTAAYLRKGSFQTDPSEATLALYEKYWEELKMGG